MSSQWMARLILLVSLSACCYSVEFFTVEHEFCDDYSLLHVLVSNLSKLIVMSVKGFQNA